MPNFDPTVKHPHNSGPDGEWATMVDGLVTMCAHHGPVVAWSVYFTDGSVLRSTNATWDGSRAMGVQAMTTFHENGQRAIWGSVDAYALPGAETVKLGEMVDFDVYEQVYDTARLDGWRP